MTSRFHTIGRGSGNIDVDQGTILTVQSSQNVESETKNVQSKIAFSLQEIGEKIIKTVATI